MSGFHLMHRELYEKPIWLNSTPEQKCLIPILISLANHSDNEWEFKGEIITVKRGQFITSLDSLVGKCGKGVTIQNVRTALKRFEKLEFLTNESTNKNRLITLCNYDKYQEVKRKDNKEANKQPTSGQQADNKQLTPNKEFNQLNQLNLNPPEITSVDDGYAYRGDKFNINQNDFAKHRNLFPNLDLLQEYPQLDLELRDTAKKQIWGALNAKLNYRNKKRQPSNQFSQQPKLSTIEQSTEINREYHERITREIAELESREGYGGVVGVANA